MKPRASSNQFHWLVWNGNELITQFGHDGAWVPHSSEFKGGG
jgi:hypothetical protein